VGLDWPHPRDSRRPTLQEARGWDRARDEYPRPPSHEGDKAGEARGAEEQSRREAVLPEAGVCRAGGDSLLLRRWRNGSGHELELR